MAGKPDNKRDPQGMLPNPQTTPESGLSTGQIGSLIIKMNTILHDEFYPSLGKAKTHQFEEIWGAIQGLLCAEAISAAQGLAKTACDPPKPQASYAAVTQAGLPSQPTTRIQPVPRTLTQEVHISRRNCPSPVKDGLRDPTKVVPMLNQAISQFSIGQVEAAQALPSGDLVLRVDSKQTRQELHRQRGWTEALGAGTQLNRPHFTVLVKSVRLDALDCSNQEVAKGTLTQQNPYLRGSDLIHVGREQAHQPDPPPKASTVLIDVGSPQEANLLIQEGLVLGYVHHSVELFHRNC